MGEVYSLSVSKYFTTVYCFQISFNTLSLFTLTYLSLSIDINICDTV